MKQALSILLLVLLPIVVFGQLMPIQRNYWTTNPVPVSGAMAAGQVPVATSASSAEWSPQTFLTNGHSVPVTVSNDWTFYGQVTIAGGVGPTTITNLQIEGDLTSTNHIYKPTLVANLPSPAAGTFPQLYVSDVVTSRGTGDFVYYDGASWRTREHIIATANLTNFVLNCAAQAAFLQSPISTIILGSGLSGASGSGLAGASLLPRTSAASPGYNGTYTNGAYSWFSTGGSSSGNTWAGSLTEPALANGYIYASGGIYCLGNAPDGTDNYWCLVGLSPTVSGYPTSGAFFLYDRYTNAIAYGTVPDNATANWTNNWICVTRKNGTGDTYTDSGLPVTIATSNPADRLLVIVTTTSALFYTNNVLAVTHGATTIPTTILHTGVVGITKYLGTNARRVYEAQPYVHIRHVARLTP